MELIGTTISRLLDWSPNIRARRPTRWTSPAQGPAPPKIALDTSNIQDCLVGVQGSLPAEPHVTRGLAPTCTKAESNLVLVLLYNLRLESTGLALNDGTELSTDVMPDGSR